MAEGDVLDDFVAVAVRVVAVLTGLGKETKDCKTESLFKLIFS